MSQKNTSVAEVLTQLQKTETESELQFLKKKENLIKTYEQKKEDLAKNLAQFAEKQQKQYALRIKDAGLLAKKGARADAAKLQKTFDGDLIKAKKKVSDAKKAVLGNLV